MKRYVMMDGRRVKRYIYDNFRKPRRSASRSTGRYFLSQVLMRDARWREAVANSELARQGGVGKVVHMVCGCGCGVGCRVEPLAPLLDRLH